MTDLSSSTMQTSDRRLPWTLALKLAVILLLILAGAAAFVHLQDVAAAHALLEQVQADGGPLHRTSCSGCSPAGISVAAVVGWVTDGRALLVWAVAVAACTATALVVHQHLRAARPLRAG